MPNNVCCLSNSVRQDSTYRLKTLKIFRLAKICHLLPVFGTFILFKRYLPFVIAGSGAHFVTSSFSIRQTSSEYIADWSVRILPFEIRKFAELNGCFLRYLYRMCFRNLYDCSISRIIIANGSGSWYRIHNVVDTVKLFRPNVTYNSVLILFFSSNTGLDPSNNMRNRFQYFFHVRIPVIHSFWASEVNTTSTTVSFARRYVILQNYRIKKSFQK